MMNRRRFVTVLAGSTVAPSAATSWGRSALPESVSTSSGRSRVSLNGEWERYVDNVRLDAISVPSSQRPSGFYQLRREFLLPRLSAGQRAVLHFDAITYYGEVSVNGKPLGSMGPYVPHEFEFTAQAKEGINHVEVGIADLTPAPDGGGQEAVALGVNPGWEAYGGIIRDVYVEVRPAFFIENVRLGYKLSSNYAQAACSATAFVSSQKRGTAHVVVSLEQGDSRLARAEKTFQLSPEMTEVELQFDVQAPALWSPESPNLYDLQVRLESEDGDDEWSTRVGFREVEIRGNRFLLNGDVLVLKGVCRHDMWKGEGFTLTAAQMEEDMRMIKELRCNFVRLVHYPHHRRIIELADELGLLVSEEPGYWQVNFATMPRPMIELGYDIMERTIRRDWNSPSVFAWLLGNESRLTVEYLKEGKERCRKLDPLARPVSFANDMAVEHAKPIYEQAGMDFFDQHIYPSDEHEYQRVAEFYAGSRPLTFTEWGWDDMGGGVIFPERHTDVLLDLVQQNQLAGHAFWSWQDIRQYSRRDWTTVNGILQSGVVSESRDVRSNWRHELARLFGGEREQSEAGQTRPIVLPLRRSAAAPHEGFKPVDLGFVVDGPDGRKTWAAFEASMAKFWHESRMARDQWERTGKTFLLWHESEIEIGGIPFRIPVVNKSVRPLMLTPQVPEAVIPVNHECAKLHILGQVTLPSGFPIVGRRGVPIATYHLLFAGGEKQEVAIRSGVEAAAANCIYEATRINPVATRAQRALEYAKDIAREDYQVLLLSLPIKNKRLEEVRLTLHDGDLALAIFGLTAEWASSASGPSVP